MTTENREEVAALLRTELPRQLFVLEEILDLLSLSVFTCKTKAGREGGEAWSCRSVPSAGESPVHPVGWEFLGAQVGW